MSIKEKRSRFHRNYSDSLDFHLRIYQLIDLNLDFDRRGHTQTRAHIRKQSEP